MNTEEQVNKILGWDAVQEKKGDDSFIKFEVGKKKRIGITDWRVVEVNKFDSLKIEFQAKCVKEDNQIVDKRFTTISNRLHLKLKEILANRNPSDIVEIEVLAMGEGYDRQYYVEVIPDMTQPNSSPMTAKHSIPPPVQDANNQAGN